MSSSEHIIERIKDAEQWPTFENAEFLDTLDQLAQQAMERESVDGYLAAILIYHQLTEDTLRVLIRDSLFLIQVSIHPLEIEVPNDSRLMFGQVIDRLKKSVNFDQKADIVQLAEELNQIRIEYVHGLTKKTTVTDIEPKARRVAKLAGRIYDLFDDAHDWFRLCFNDLRKDLEGSDESETAYPSAAVGRGEKGTRGSTRGDTD